MSGEARSWAEVRSTLRANPFVRLLLPLVAVLALLPFFPLDRDTVAVLADIATVPLLLLLTLAFRHQLGEVRRESERQLRAFLSLAMVFWLVGHCVDRFLPQVLYARPWGLLVDLAYVLFYCCLFLAVATEPHRQHASLFRRPQYRFEAAATLVFICGLFTYLILIPVTFNPVQYDSLVPSMLLYLVLDGIVLLRVAVLLPGCRSRHWQSVYGWLALAVALWLACELTEAMMYTGVLTEVPAGTAWDLLWYLPFFTLGWLAGICSRQEPARAEIQERAAEPAGTAGGVMAATPVVGYAFLFPLIYFAFATLGLFDAGTRFARHLALLSFLLVLALIAWLHDRFLEMDRNRAVEQLKSARDALEDQVEKRTAQLASTNRSLQEEIRERLRTEAELRRNNQFLTSLVEGSPLAIATLDQKSRIVSSNPAFEELFQFSAAECVGKRLDELIVPPEQRTSGDELTKRVQAGETIQHEATRQRADGTPVQVSVLGIPVIVGGEQVGIFAVYMDNTERNRLEDQLRQSQKMEAVGRLAGGVAHDFNNLLTGITGYAELLRARVDSGSALRQDLDTIRELSERAAHLTRQLLTFARRQPLAPALSDLNRVVEETLEILQRLIGEDIDLDWTPCPDLHQVQVDPGQIQQVLMNLAINARDAMPKGGKLQIETAVAAPYQQRGKSGPGPWILLSVRDTGYGMDDGIRERIFEPFFTTKDPTKGTGLGLSTVYGIVQQHGGEIWVESKPGRGTTFNILLSGVDGESNEAAPGRVALTAAGGVETILFVEDEAAVRDVAVRVLDGMGYKVLDAATPAEALEICTGYDEEIHLVVTDVVMPGMDGRELARRLEGSCRRFLFISGYADDTVAGRLSEVGAEFLQKPFAPDTLAARVREVLDTPLDSRPGPLAG